MKQARMAEVRRAFWLGLAAGLVLGVVQPASAQMLEGTLSGTFAAFGTVNAKATGKERTVLAIDENGLSVTNGLLDHMTWNCSGLADFTNGIGQNQGFCAGRDPVGARSSSTGSQRSTRRTRRLCTERSPGPAAPENTRASAATERMWIIPENSDH
jgi:hypothetical protein